MTDPFSGGRVEANGDITAVVLSGSRAGSREVIGQVPEVRGVPEEKEEEPPGTQSDDPFSGVDLEEQLAAIEAQTSAGPGFERESLSSSSTSAAAEEEPAAETAEDIAEEIVRRRALAEGTSIKVARNRIAGLSDFDQEDIDQGSILPDGAKPPPSNIKQNVPKIRTPTLFKDESEFDRWARRATITPWGLQLGDIDPFTKGMVQMDGSLLLRSQTVGKTPESVIHNPVQIPVLGTVPKGVSGSLYPVGASYDPRLPQQDGPQGDSVEDRLKDQKVRQISNGGFGTGGILSPPFDPNISFDPDEVREFVSFSDNFTGNKDEAFYIDKRDGSIYNDQNIKIASIR